MIKILVTGAEGQLGQCLQKISGADPSLHFDFRDRNTLDITDQEAVQEAFRTGLFDYCINTAAYTHVDEAEHNPEAAFKVNACGARYLALACEQLGVTLIHISTDYVFDGEKAGGYSPEDAPNPINEYGKSKLKGEKYIQTALQRYFIIRTSWLYSEFGHNFVKTMLRLRSEREPIRVVNDQWGSPTYAGDVANFLFEIIATAKKNYGIYHFCNGGKASWHEFAMAIFRHLGSSVSVLSVDSNSLPKAARRPQNSLLITSGTKAAFNIRIPTWEESLTEQLYNIVRKTSMT